MTDNLIRKHTLANGLTLLGECNPANVSASIGFFVRTGARDETPVESGVSHFLEHMMFKGTPTRSSMDITYQMGNIGAQANAWTSEENTVYYACVIPEYFGTMQELLSDMLRPSLDPKEFATEKKVILEEIALYQDRPFFYLYEHATRDYFGDHPAGNSVLGSTQTVGELSQAQMRDYFDRRYSPARIVLVASGKFDWDSFVSDAEKYCGSWKNLPAGREAKPHMARELEREYRKKNLMQSHIVLMTTGPSAQDDDRYPASILATILGDSSGSKLYWELVDPGTVESASMESDEKDGAGCFVVSAGMEPEKMESVSKTIRKVLASPRDFSDEDLARAKTKLISRIVLGGELPMGRLMALGIEWNYRQKSSALSEIIDRVRAVDRNQIESMLDKYPLTPWSEFRLVPE